MRRAFITSLGLLPLIAYAAETGTASAADTGTVVDTAPATEPQADPEKANKSIVPAKYNQRYKNGGSDELAAFINDQCTAKTEKGKGDFEYSAFFELCKLNGVDGEKVDHYAGLVNEKAHGAQGRARMTLRNMLATIARKNGKLVGLDKQEYPINIAKPAVSGAAAEAQAKSEAEKPADATPGTAEVDGEGTEQGANSQF